MKRLLTFLCALCLTIATAWADAGRMGSFAISGMMTGDINFRIDAQYWGTSPAIVAGETHYYRKDGGISVIKIYGTMDEEHCSLREFIDNRECGHFEINNMPAPEALTDLGRLVGTPLEGYWEGNGKLYDFENVSISQVSNDFSHNAMHRPADLTRLSGVYGYRKVTELGNTFNNVALLVKGDSIEWHFEGADDELGSDYSLEATTPLHHNVEGLSPDVLRVEADGGEYIIVPMDEFLFIERNNELPEGTDDFIDLRGLFVRYVDVNYCEREKKFGDSDSDGAASARCMLITPRTDNERLNASIHSWVARHCGAADGLDYCEMAKNAVSNFIDSDDLLNEEDSSMANLYSDETQVAFDYYTEKKFINLICKGATYMGGAHGMPFCTIETLRRSDGKVMEWEDWFVNPAKVRPIIERYMYEQNEDVDFDGESLALPSNAPYFSPGYLHFSYQPYEAAAYCFGMPECEIPVDKLLPYMTSAAKKLVK